MNYKAVIASKTIDQAVTNTTKQNFQQCYGIKHLLNVSYLAQKDRREEGWGINKL